MKHLALTFAATILFASSAFASHPGGGHPGGGGGGGGHPGRSMQHSAPAMGGTGGSQMQRSGGNHSIVGRGPENGRGVYNRQERHHGHFRFLIPGGGYGYCDNPDLIGTPNWLIYCE
ncbi:MAG: hypothetical protein WCD69_02530 [Xanthobacteraceae bacterium]